MVHQLPLKSYCIAGENYQKIPVGFLQVCYISDKSGFNLARITGEKNMGQTHNYQGQIIRSKLYVLSNIY